MLGVFLWPLLRYGWLSLQASSVLTGLDAIPNGGANWRRLLGDARFWTDAAFTLRFAAVSVTLELVLGLAIALLLHRATESCATVVAIVTREPSAAMGIA